MSFLRASLIVCALVAAAGCGADSPIKPKPVPEAPTLTCPATQQLITDGAPVPLFFTAVPAGGQSPVQVTCSVPPGSTFPLGSSMVTCTVTDALSRQASCNFNVTVSIVPRISKTTFLAFGDSLTLGRCGAPPTVCTGAYVPRLHELLLTRYWRQSFTFSSAGVPSERADEGAARLLSELVRYNPEVLLLMEGTNDMTSSPPRDVTGLQSLENMISIAEGRGVKVFIATIPPVAPGGPNNGIVSLVPGFNDKIRAMAARRNVPVVDIFAALNADVPRYYSGNDLHPLAEGYRVMGETFYAVISAVLDNTPAASMSRR